LIEFQPGTFDQHSIDFGCVIIRFVREGPSPGDAVKREYATALMFPL